VTHASDPALDEAYASARALLGHYPTLARTERRAFIAALRPAYEELAQIFVSPVIDRVHEGYQLLWGNAPEWPAAPDEELTVACARVEDLARPSAVSDRFSAYRWMWMDE
jgi:hypothetical protein